MNKKTRLFAFSILGLTVVIVHFILILTALGFDLNDEIDLFETDNHPVMAKLDHYSWEYIHPLFTQDWFLFAPHPISSNESIEVKGYYFDQNRKQTAETEWLSINEYIRGGLQRNRLSELNFYRNTYSQVIDPVQWQFDYVNNEMQLDRNDYSSAEEAKAFVPLERYSAFFLHKKYPDLPFQSMDVKIKITFPYKINTDQRTFPEESISIRHLLCEPLRRGETDANSIRP